MATTVNHVMIDLETLGTVPGCIGFSIGAVQFDPAMHRLGSTFYAVVNVDSALDHYLREDEATVEWWSKQSPEARVTLEDARAGNGMTLPDAMNRLNDYFQSLGTKSTIRVWGNGADFDNPILRVMYDAAKVTPYPGGYGGRCYRTMKNLDELFGPTFKFHKLDSERHRVGTHHNALDDAKSQAMHLMANVARIKSAIDPTHDEEEG